MKMSIENTKISGVSLVQTSSFKDNRGLFTRFYCEKELEPVLSGRKIVQINFSKTLLQGAFRGFHYQKPPHCEMKLIRCLKGKVLDFALDLRKNSDTFLQWITVELSGGDDKMFVIPQGCAHGFQTLEPDSELLYLHTEFYHPESEGGVRYDDPLIHLSLPLKVQEISSRDCSHSLLSNDFKGIAI